MKKSMHDKEGSICFCKLENGNILEYEMAVGLDYWNTHSLYVDSKKWRYLGEGVIYSVNGILQNGKEKDKFWACA
jgi:hypothetical protein